jgi:hypothetical protein
MVPLEVYYASRLVEACCLVLCCCDTYSLPPALGCRPRVCDLHLPKDLCLLYKLDGSGRELWLAQGGPEVVLSREVAEYLVPEVHVRPAMEGDVSDNLSPLPTLAAGAGNAWYSPGEKEVVQTDFLSAKLHLQRALSFSESLVELEHFLGGHRCVSVRCSALSLRLPLRPSSLHPLASLAALSAASSPGMPTWAEVHLTVTGRPMSRISFTCCATSARM